MSRTAPFCAANRPARRLSSIPAESLAYPGCCRRGRGAGEDPGHAWASDHAGAVGGMAREFACRSKVHTRTTVFCSTRFRMVPPVRFSAGRVFRARTLAGWRATRVCFGEQTLDVHHCPGHTPGHVIFFTGRTGLRSSAT